MIPLQLVELEVELKVLHPMSNEAVSEVAYQYFSDEVPLMVESPYHRSIQ